MAIDAWNLLGGLEWGGLPTAVEMLGVEDPETLVQLLAHIRNEMRKD